MPSGRALRRTLAIGVLAVAVCPLSIVQAYAQCAAPIERAIALKASVSVPRNRPIGSVLYASEHPLPRVDCLASSTPTPIAVHVQALPAGDARDIYRTGVSAIGVRLSIGGRSLSTVDQAGSEEFPTADAGSMVRVELIKIDESDVGGEVRGSDLPVLVYGQGNAVPVGRMSFVGAIEVQSVTCNAESLRVRLDPLAIAALARPGESAGAKSFELRLSDCPAGIARIGFRLDPLGSRIEGAASVLALDGGSEASGVGVQVRDGSGVPIELGTTHWLGTTGVVEGALRIPLQAAYYRTGDEPVRAGSLVASMTFTISYE